MLAHLLSLPDTRCLWVMLCYRNSGLIGSNHIIAHYSDNIKEFAMQKDCGA
ncbi:Uncharacterised protein [Rikenella microfusus]|uniref:Uncharacterized protein n=1 Tax=Rikenella microfusus TaxID=28139 RepID=A0A379MTD0_9BACT|nr:Uncharacterised protein [Rikenella microfusus]